MARTLHRLTNATVVGHKKPGYLADGGGLYLRVAPGGSKGWVFRFKLNGKAREAGLGGYPAISLAKARERAGEFRRLHAEGIDPIESRKEIRAAARRQKERQKTFEECANACIESHEAGWRNDKHRAQWRSTLRTYAYPLIGQLPIAAVDTEAVLKVLNPIWTEKPETASRLRQRIERVLSWARVHGYREGENSAQWRGHLDQLLPAKSAIRRVEHHVSLDYRDVPEFMALLRGQKGNAAHALEFLILTAARTGEVIGARWDEIDLTGRLWIVPAARMKAQREHRVPLSHRAISILQKMIEQKRHEIVFPGARSTGGLSQMALIMAMRRLRYRDSVTPHGFRSSFRDWAAEMTRFPREVAEMALAHAVPSAVEAAYRRGDLLLKRRQLMDAWSKYCSGEIGPARILTMNRMTNM